MRCLGVAVVPASGCVAGAVCVVAVCSIASGTADRLTIEYEVGKVPITSRRDSSMLQHGSLLTHWAACCQIRLPTGPCSCCSVVIVQRGPAIGPLSITLFCLWKHRDFHTCTYPASGAIRRSCDAAMPCPLACQISSICSEPAVAPWARRQRLFWAITKAAWPYASVCYKAGRLVVISSALLLQQSAHS